MFLRFSYFGANRGVIGNLDRKGYNKHLSQDKCSKVRKIVKKKIE